MGSHQMVRIGIIGAGNIGGTLARWFTALGHDVAVVNSDCSERLAGLAAETGAPARAVLEAARGRDMAIAALPRRYIPDLPAGLFEVAPDGPVVVDTDNYYPRQRDGRIELGHPVVKAFNKIDARHLLEQGKPAGTPGRVPVPVAGDEPAATALVVRLIDELGFHPVDADGLDESWRRQPVSPVDDEDYDAGGLPPPLAEAIQERTLEWRASPQSPGDFGSAA